MLVTLSEGNEAILKTIRTSAYKTSASNGNKRSCFDQVENPLFHQSSERCP